MANATDEAGANRRQRGERLSCAHAPTASTKSASGGGTRTGLAGTLLTWRRSSRVANCRNEPLCRDRPRPGWSVAAFGLGFLEE
jgi:hypothetical protein